MKTIPSKILKCQEPKEEIMKKKITKFPSLQYESFHFVESLNLNLNWSPSARSKYNY